MLFKYTGPEETVVKFGVTFTGHELAEVTDPEAIRRLLLNVEFEEVHAEKVDAEKADVKVPARRGRKPKA